MAAHHDITCKSCRKCGQIKSLHEFVALADRPDGRTSQCKECAAAYAREFRRRPGFQAAQAARAAGRRQARADETAQVIREGRLPDLAPDDPWSWTRFIVRFIPGYPDYCVTSSGEVWSRKTLCQRGVGRRWRRREPVRISHDHRAVNLWDAAGHCKMHYVHALVLEAFIGPRPAGMHARHFPDRDPANNDIRNLQWGTPKENSHDAIFHGTLRRGSSHGSAKLTEEDVRAIRSLHSGGCSVSEVARRYGVNWSTIDRILRGRRWTHVAEAT